MRLTKKLTAEGGEEYAELKIEMMTENRITEVIINGFAFKVHKSEVLTLCLRRRTAWT